MRQGMRQVKGAQHAISGCIDSIKSACGKTKAETETEREAEEGAEG